MVRSVACQRCVRRRYYANLLHDTGLEGSSYFLPVPSPKPFASWDKRQEDVSELSGLCHRQQRPSPGEKWPLL
ncbi:hypothetical protein U0070_015633 [Myodes glareolus]|uniref:Uncharacterized protein n=1 Tax=Myodes glareolus TaxID=447135 RepID=A0AAW0HQI3_MYOGA